MPTLTFPVDLSPTLFILEWAEAAVTIPVTPELGHQPFPLIYYILLHRYRILFLLNRRKKKQKKQRVEFRKLSFRICNIHFWFYLLCDPFSLNAKHKRIMSGPLLFI